MTKIASAAPLRRLAALGYDLLLLLAIAVMFTLAVWIARGGREIPPGTLWFQLSLVGIAMLFYAWFWSHGGQTLGMRAWRIRVENRDTTPLSWQKALARFWLALLVALPAGAGWWWCLIDAERRCWHDRLTQTRVVRAASERGPRPRS